MIIACMHMCLMFTNSTSVSESGLSSYECVIVVDQSRDFFGVRLTPVLA